MKHGSSEDRSYVIYGLKVNTLANDPSVARLKVCRNIIPQTNPD